MLNHSGQLKMRKVLATSARFAVMSLCLLLLTQPSYAKDAPSNLENISLKSFAKWLRSVTKDVNKKVKEGDAASVEVNQLTELYAILNKLQDTRGAYIQSLQYLIDAREQHLPEQTVFTRSKAVTANAKDLYTELKVLDRALEPLQLSLDLHHPDVSIRFRQYQQRQEAQVKETQLPEMVGTFTLKELKTIDKDARNNGDTLKQSIDGLAQTLKKLKPSGGA